jgi:hypothetical protein
VGLRCLASVSGVNRADQQVMSALLSGHGQRFERGFRAFGRWSCESQHHLRASLMFLSGAWAERTSLTSLGSESADRSFFYRWIEQVRIRSAEIAALVC